MKKPEQPLDLSHLPEDGVPYTPVYDEADVDQLGYGVMPINYRHPCWIDEDRTLLPTLYTADGFPVIDFDPVPQQRRRRIGWDEKRQRAFVALLAHTPSIGWAARTVGMSPQSFYRLIERPGAEQFAKAVDLALDHGLMQLRLTSVGRGLGEDAVPVFRRGRHVRTELRRNDRLAIAILGQSGADQDRMRHNAQLRWRTKREWAALDARKAAEAALLVDHDAILAEAAQAADAARAALRIPGIRQL